MIINALGQLIYWLLNVLLIFNLPQLPDTISTILSQVVSYITTGLQIITSFIGTTAVGVLGLLLGLFLSMHAAYMLYSLVAFVLRKIPLLGVKM